MKDKIEQWLEENDIWYGHGSKSLANYMTECLTELQPQWVSVDDRLPESGAANCVLITRGGTVGHGYKVFGGWRIAASNDFYNDSRVTHWQEKPLPPSEGE
jgi:hypothetical protein